MARPVRLAEPPPRFPLQVLSVEHLADEVFRVELERHPMPWTAGDCVTVHVPGAEAGNPYSFSGDPEGETSEFWVRRFPEGRVSRVLCDLQAGDTVEVSPPFGWFRPLEPVEAPRLYLATGTGIAPFLSACVCGRKENLQLLWGMRVPLPVPEVLDGVNMTRCVSRTPYAGMRSGRVTDLLEELELPPGVHVYLCGLDAMIREASHCLIQRGVPETHLHSECFFTASSSAS